MSKVIHLLMALWLTFNVSAYAQPVAPPAGLANIKLTGPFKKDNLSIFIIGGPDRIKNKNILTLEEALKQKKVTVHETSNVNTLEIENQSDEIVFVQSGQIFKGGKQDRTMQSDIMLPPLSGRIPISVFCVEHGRWTKRGNESAAAFQSAASMLPAPAIRYAARCESDQSQVWNQVAKAQKKLSSSVGASVAASPSPTSLQLTLENKKVQESANARAQELENAINKMPNAIGYVCAVNGKITSADMYASSALFKKLWPELLKASAVDSIADADAKKFSPPSQAQAMDYLAQPLKAKPTQKQVSSQVQEFKQESGDVVMFKTLDKSEHYCVHVNYLTK
jgi:hypothetical protein